MPSLTLSSRSVRAIGVAAMALAVSVSVIAARRSPPPPPFQTPLGNTLPDVDVQTPDGHTVKLLQSLHGKPALLYVFSAEECASCSNLPLEFTIVHNEAPNLQTILIGSGSPREAFQPLIQSMHLEQSALIDEHREILRAFDVTREPMVLLVDSSGAILLADTRNASRAAQYPMGRILRGIGSILGGPRQ